MNNSKIIDGEELKGKIGAFTQYLIDEEKSNSTIEGYRRNVKRFIEFIGKSKINKNTVLEYKSALMNMYKTAYRNIALAVFGIGLCLVPFIQNIVTKVDVSDGYIRLVFVLFLTQTASSYLFSY